MDKRQLLQLFLCSLVPWTIGNGMTSLLPIYAAELGASPAVAGCQMSLYFVALAAGTLSAGWLSDRLKRRKALLIAGGVISLPALLLMGRVTNSWALAAASATWYFWAGMSITLINILAGLCADESARGRVFGILALNSGLGSLIGGLAMGPIAERWGYPTMFVLLSLFGLLWPATGFFLKDTGVKQPKSTAAAAAGPTASLGRGFYLLFLGSSVAAFAAYVFIMGRSLVMHDLGFGAASIAATSALSELPILPLPLLLGWLSDRVGRRQFLMLGYLATTAGLLGLTASASLGHFMITSVLISISFVTGAVGTALVTDLVPQVALGRGLSLFGATTWIAGVLGFAGAGCAIQHLGPVSTFVVGALLPLLAIGFLVPIQGSSREPTPTSTGLAKAAV